MISEMNQNREKNDQGKGKPEADNDEKQTRIIGPVMAKATAKVKDRSAGSI